MLRYSVRFALATLLWALAAGPAVGEPRVVASIPPVHALVAGVMAGVGEPELLMRGGGSPHAYSLRPSQALALREAEVVFWVGEALETFLEKPLQSLAGGARVVELLEAPGVQLLPVRAGGAWEGEGHHGGEQTAGAGPGAEGHDHGGVNPHVWLDPANASALVTAIATALSRADPAHRAAYAANAGRLRSALADLDAELRARLAPVRARPFVVFHDAYAYLEQAYGPGRGACASCGRPSGGWARCACSPSPSSGRASCRPSSKAARLAPGCWTPWAPPCPLGPGSTSP